MSSCFDDIEVENIDGCSNSDVPAGVSEVGIFYAVHSQATTIPMPLKKGEVGYNYEKSVTVASPIVFPATKGFATINVQPDTGEVKVSGVGNKGNRKLKQTFDFFVADNKPKLLGFLRTHLNTPMIFIVTERDGQKRLLGDAFSPAYLTESEVTTGKGGEDDKGGQFTIETYAAVIVYNSTIQLAGPTTP